MRSRILFSFQNSQLLFRGPGLARIFVVGFSYPAVFADPRTSADSGKDMKLTLILGPSSTVIIKKNLQSAWPEIHISIMVSKGNL